MILLLLLLAPAASAQTARLESWDGLATAIDNGGRGEDFYRLQARVSWPKTPIANPPASLRIELPDGTTRTQTLARGEGPGGRRITALVPSAAVRDLAPSQVKLRAWLVDASGAPLGEPLRAGISQFPTPATDAMPPDLGPFGWGTPLGPGPAVPLPRKAPDGSTYVCIERKPPLATLYAATAEATVGQLARFLPGYDPRAGRSDEFLLEGRDQPAVGLSPARATVYLAALRKADRSGVAYRLPTADEWSTIARAGSASAFWWGDEPTHPAGANFLGPEPSLPLDTTAPAESPGFVANPFGLRHTFGNVEEWAVRPEGGFLRLGGHFRTEPASPLPPTPVDDPSSFGPDPFVGVRPVFDIDANRGTAAAHSTLKGLAGLEGVRAIFDPQRATVTLSGKVAEPSLRRLADTRIASLWYVAAVLNDLTTPVVPEGRLATLGAVLDRRSDAPFGKPQTRSTLAVRWGSPLPVEGSSWWVNIYQDDRHVAHRLVERQPGTRGRLVAVAEQATIYPSRPRRVALSLGGPAPTADDKRVVSNVIEVRP